MLGGATRLVRRLTMLAWGLVADGDGEDFERLLLRRVRACQARCPRPQHYIYMYNICKIL